MNFRAHATPRQPLVLNVTAFVDILLCLLVFLLSSWAYSQQETNLKLELPAANTGTNDRPPPLKVVINLDREGIIRVNDKVLDEPGLTAMLARLTDLDPDQEVTLRVDRLLPYERVLRTLDLCRQSNVHNISFSALPEKKN